MAKKRKKKLSSPVMEETLPHQIYSPSFKNSGIDIQEPFVNQHGVVIGDSLYDSPNSPLNHWSTEVDPAIMAGEEWVHPTNDIGCNSSENEDLLQEGIPPQGVPFTHPSMDVSYGRD